MRRTVAILQSNYIPWKGYFDLLAASDCFVFYDIVQYTTNDWRNRNRIKTQNGPLWLTIPVRHAGRFGQRIDEVEVEDDRWRSKHWRSIDQAYARAEFFASYRERFRELYLGSSERLLSAINRAFIENIASCLGIESNILDAATMTLPEDRVDRLIAICSELGADTYLSGPAAKAYLDESRFLQAGIEVRFMDYSGYPEYTQLYPPFEHSVSALDLLFNAGPDALSHMQAGQSDPRSDAHVNRSE
jgi:hypothetical protein